MAEVTISDAEWEVMNAVWDGGPLTAQEIVENLSGSFAWAPATIKTMLHRLTKKGVLTFEQQGNRYLYQSAVARTDCVRHACQSFLNRVFAGEPSSLIAHFIQSSHLSAGEVAQLRQLLSTEKAKRNQQQEAE